MKSLWDLSYDDDDVYDNADPEPTDPAESARGDEDEHTLRERIVVLEGVLSDILDNKGEIEDALDMAGGDSSAYAALAEAAAVLR